MSLSRLETISIRSLLLGGAALALSSLSCGREPTGPGGAGMVPSKAIGFSTEFPSAFPAYQAAGGTGIAFAKVRVVLTRTDRLIALDTTVAYPDTATALQLTLRVLLPSSTSSTGVPMVLNLDYIAADGTVVFHGGPATVTVIPITSDSTPPPPSEVTIPIKYTGPGATATKVVISPSVQQADSGAAFSFTAQAQDAAGKVVANTPIAFTSQDTSIAKVNAATGVGTAGSQRGSTSIVATLLTGQTATATLNVVKPAKTIAQLGGDGQAGSIGAALPLPIKVVVKATDGFPSPGVGVTFAAQNGGSVGATTVVTAADGTAQTTWTLGAAPGAQTATATVTGLAGSPVTFTATASSTGPGPAKVLAFTSQPTDGVPTVALPSFIVTARDSANALATGFSGNVSLALGANAGGATLSGTLTVAATGGVATFSNVKLDKVGTGYTLVASASGLTSATSAAFNIANSTASSTTVTPHLDTLTAIGATFALSAQARDANNTIVAGHFAWVSRTPGVASVDTNGVVKALTNGTAWVVATEVGGTKDSAQIVVAQKLASIKVTPNPRSIYFGASYQFAANAVDGLGVPLATQPTFTWSTGSSAVATVNSTGLATGTGIGATQVQATSGAITGVAALNVLSQITRIVVSRDSAGFPKTASDTFTVAALGATRSYIATALDTLLQPMTGITFAWTSSNGAVATLDSIASATVRATARANGVSAIRATAQGITGAAQFNVQQVLVSIDLSPATAAVAPTGKTVLVARGKDANGFFIPGGSFTFASTQPQFATVDTAGVVTGVANGTTSVTAASGAITSNAATVTVGGTVPPAITFGRDTLTVGRSGSKSIPVYLSTPFGSPLTVNLAVRDTFAFFSTATVSIAAGQTSVNATLNGHNAGTTAVYATDGSGAGYAGDTAVLAVQASVKFTTTSYSLNVTDQRATQVLLSDPSPAGGTYVTFSYGTAGMVNVSPDPAFIPAGQLAADVVLLATGANGGGTLVTPAATGVSGTASTVYTYPATLTGPIGLRLGAGQFELNQYVAAQASFVNPLGVTLTSSDSTTVSAPAGVTIPANTYYAYYPVSGVRPGKATITASASGWTSLVDTITVTTPKVGVCCAGTYNTTQPQFTMVAYAEDSVSTAHYRTDPLVVSATSSDPSVLTVVTPTISIPAGQYYTYFPVVPGGATGNARIIVTASGHNPDSTGLFTIVGPKLSFSWTALRVGAGEQDQNLYVYTPNNVAGTPLTVSIANTDSTILGLPPTITIPVGTNYAYFNARGKTPGSVTLYASAPGYSPDTATYTVTTGKLVLSAGTTLDNFSPPSGITTYAADTTRNAHPATAPVIVTYTTTDASVLTVTGTDTIQPGNASTSHARITPVGVGTAQVIGTASGFIPDTSTFTVRTPKLNLSWNTLLLGRRQYEPSSYYVYTPGTRASPLAVTMTPLHPTIDSVPATVTIPGGTNYAYFSIAGLATGTDTLIASAPGYVPDTGVVVVTTPRFSTSNLPSTATTTNPPATLNVYTTDSVGTAHYALDTVVVRATSSNSAVLQPTAPGFRITAGQVYGQAQVAYVGPGSASITYDDSLGTGYQPVTTNTVAVTGPSLSLNGGTAVLGMRQNDGGLAYVQVPNAVTGSPLVVNLASSDPTVATVPATVSIPVGYDYAYFQITAHDVAGTIQVQATATGYTGATKSVQVTQPKFLLYTPSSVNTTSPPQYVEVYAADANGTAHYTNEDVVVTLASSAPSVGIVDSAVVTIVAGTYYSYTANFIPLSVGTTQVSATDARVASYKYAQATADVAVNTPSLYLYLGYNTLGIGQYVDAEVDVPDAAAADLTVNVSHFSSATTSPSSVTITKGTYYTYARVTGAATGTDSITISEAGHTPAKAAIAVSNGRLDPGSWPSQIGKAGDSVAVLIYARDVNGSTHYVSAPTTVTLAPTGNIQFVSGGASSAVITSAVIPADQYYVQVWVKATGSGSGSATLSASNYTTYASPTINIP